MNLGTVLLPFPFFILSWSNFLSASPGVQFDRYIHPGFEKARADPNCKLLLADFVNDILDDTDIR